MSQKTSGKAAELRQMEFDYSKPATWASNSQKRIGMKKQLAAPRITIEQLAHNPLWCSKLLPFYPKFLKVPSCRKF